MKANGIPRLSIQQMNVVKNLNLNNDFVGFFGKEVKTCATIEEGIKSFDGLEEQRRINALKPFTYKS